MNHLPAPVRAVFEGAWLVILLVLALAICGASFIAVGYLTHLGWTVFR